MNAERYNRLYELFVAARELGADERGAFVAARCDGDAELRSELEALLREADTPEPVQDSGPLDAKLDDVQLRLLADEGEDPALPERIGPYRILAKLGEGGMGTVYEAEQEHPRRRVALKVLRDFWAHPSRAARFEREVEILGQLQHPGIAVVHDAGMAETPSGALPYLAMERVDGLPLLDAVRVHELDRRARLVLFARICDAVDHAHQRGVVHRDLKPSNVLVTIEDGETRPKILDFGVARVLDSDGELPAFETHMGQLIGTLPYMSPEQASGRPSDVDARADVYALGVLLYELLSGRLPLAVHNMSAAEASRAIQEREFTKLGSLDTTCRGDLETIVGKALAKDRELRYATASELAADVRRWLRDEPIFARAPSAVYQLKKFALRHRALCAVAMLAVASLFGVSILAVVHAARVERDAAVRNTIFELFEHALGVGRDTRLGRTTGDLTRLNAKTTVAEVVRGMAEHVDSRSYPDPAVESALRYRVGWAAARTGQWKLARRLLEQAVNLFDQSGQDATFDGYWARFLLARQLVFAEQGKTSVEMLRAIEGPVEAQFGRGSEIWYKLQLELGHAYGEIGEHDNAEQVLSTLLENEKNHDNEPRRLAGIYLFLGEVLARTPKLDEAEAALEACWKTCEAHDDFEVYNAFSRNALARVAMKRSRPADAVRYAERARQVISEVLGENSDTTINLRRTLAAAYVASRRWPDALEIRQTDYERTRARHGAGGIVAQRLLNNWITTTSKAVQAEWFPDIEPYLEALRAAIEHDPQSTAKRELWPCNELAFWLHEKGHSKQARPFAQLAVARFERYEHEKWWEVAVPKAMLGAVRFAMGEKDAIELLRAAHELSRVEKEHPGVRASIAAQHALALADLGHEAEAREAIEESEAALGNVKNKSVPNAVAASRALERAKRLLAR